MSVLQVWMADVSDEVLQVWIADVSDEVLQVWVADVSDEVLQVWIADVSDEVLQVWIADVSDEVCCVVVRYIGWLLSMTTAIFKAFCLCLTCYTSLFSSPAVSVPILHC